MKEPVDHILRPRLPWRSPDEPAITECGYDASKVKSLTRSEFAARLKEMGERRTAMLTCMTCCDTARRWKPWEEDPRQAINRETAWEGRWESKGTRLKDELLAIAALIAEYPERFAALLEESERRREWQRRVDAAKSAPPVREC